MFNDTQHDHSDDHPSHSNLAYVCEQAKLHGVAPEPGEYDPRETWDRDTALGSIAIAFDILGKDIGPVGFQLADEADSVLWGFVNLFDRKIIRIDRNIDRHMPELQDLQREQDGSEIKSHELEKLTHRVQCLTSRRDAFEELRDRAAELYLEATGSVWRPRFGSHTSRTGALTSAAIDARDFVRARQDRDTRAHLPEGTLVAVCGGKEGDLDEVFSCLDSAKAKYPDMVLLHGGSPGVEQLASRWAESRQVHQVVCRPEWSKYNKAAPFRRNDELLKLIPKGVIAFPGSGIVENLCDKAAGMGIPVFRVSD